MIILIVGDYKTGKTVSSCTFPKPLLLLNLDNNEGMSIKTAKDAKGELVVKDQENITSIHFYKSGYNDMVFKTASDMDFKRPSAPSYVAQSKETVDKINTVFSTIYNNKGIYEGKQYKTLVVDSLTSLFRRWKEALMFVNSIPQLRIQDYGTLENVLYGQFIPSLKSLQQFIPYIILTDHEMMDKDELSGRIMEFPIGPSQNMGKGIGKEFDEIWRQKVEGNKYVWRTRKDGLFQAGSNLSLPDPIESTFNNLLPYLSK